MRSTLIHYLKTLDVVGLLWLTRLQHSVGDRYSASGVTDWESGPFFQEENRNGVSSSCSAVLFNLPEKFYTSVLERRVRLLVEHQIQEEQCSFHLGREIVD